MSRAANDPTGAGAPARGAGLPRRATADPHRFLIPAAQLPPGFAERVGAAVAPVVPRPAATVVLLRPADAGVEALLLRRHNRSGFAADAWVFPGGVVDAADSEPALAEACDGPTPQEWAERLGTASGAEAFGYAVAALREAFEETGILLARRAGDASGPGDLPIAPARLARHREALLAGSTSLLAIARAEGLRYRLDRLLYIAHWITPEPEPRRYDTRFFLAEVPADAACVVHAPELVEACWLAPAAAVARFEAGEMKMLPPTVHTLRRLAGYDTLDDVRTALRDAPVPAILPVMRRGAEGVTIEIPRD